MRSDWPKVAHSQGVSIFLTSLGVKLEPERGLVAVTHQVPPGSFAACGTFRATPLLSQGLGLFVQSTD